MERRMLGVFSAISFASEMRVGVFSPFFALYLRNEMGASFTEIGMITTFILGVNAVFQILWGWTSDWVGKRKHFIVLGEGIAGFVFLYIPQVRDLTLLAAVMVGIQVLWSMAAPAWKALIAEHSSPEERGSSMGKITAVGGVGSMLGLYIVGDLIPLYGYAYLFYFISLCLFAAAFLALFLKEPEELKPSRRSLVSVEQLEGLYRENRPFTMFTLLILFITFATSLVSGFYSLYAQSLGGTVQQIRYIFIVRDGATTVFLAPMGKLADKAGKVKMLQCSLGLNAFVVLLLALTPMWWALIPVMVVEGLGWSLFWVSSFAVLSSLTPREMRGMYMGFHYSVVNSLSSLASSVGGRAADVYGLKQLFYISFLTAAGVVVLFVGWLQKSRQKIGDSQN